MLDITVKTMDSQSRTFEVPESMTVGDFKRRISNSVNIPAGSQRLIFQGRVLGDTMKLTSDHHEKTLHLVQRAQPSTSSSSSTAAAATSSGGTTTNSGASIPTAPPPHLMPTLDMLNQMFAGQGMFAGAPVIGRVHHQGGSTAADGSVNIEINLDDPRSFTQPPSAMVAPSNHQHARRAADSRVNFERMWRILQLLTNIADTYSSTTAATAGSENSESGEQTPSAPPNETGAGITPTTDSTAAQDNSRPTSGGSTTSNTSLHSQSSHPRLRQPLVSELRDFYSQFIQIQGRLQPMFNQYQRFLEDDPAFTSTNSREYQDAARFFQLTPQALRHTADVYDFLANISIPLERVPPRPVMVANSNNSSRSARRSSSSSSNRGSTGVTIAQMVRGQQQQATAPPPSGGTSTQRTSTNTATRRGRFCVHQPGRGGSATSAATGGNSGSSSTAPRRGNQPSTAATTGSGSSTEQAASSGSTQQRTLPPYTFQINAHVHPRVTVTFRPSNNDQESTNQQQQPPPAQDGNISRMNFTWNGSNLTPNGNTGATAGISMDAIRNLVTNATQGNTNQAGMVVVDTANVNNVGEDISRAITDTLYSTLSTYLGQAYNNPQQQAQQQQQLLRQQQQQAQQRQQQQRQQQQQQRGGGTNNNMMATIDETGEAQPQSSSTTGQRVEVEQSSNNQGNSAVVEEVGVGNALMILARDMMTSPPYTSSSPLTSTSLNRYLRCRYNISPSTNNNQGDMFRRFVLELMEMMTFDELVIWYQNGNFPFVRLSANIRQFIINQLFQGKAPETNDDIKEGMEKMMDGLREWVSNLFANMSSPATNSNVKETNLFFIFKFLYTFITDLLLKKDEATNEADMNILLNYGISTFCHLNLCFLDGGRNSFIGLLIKYLRRDGDGIEVGRFEEVMTSLIPSQLICEDIVEMYYRQRPADIDDMIDGLSITDIMDVTSLHRHRHQQRQQQHQNDEASTSKNDEMESDEVENNENQTSTSPMQVTTTTTNGDEQQQQGGGRQQQRGDDDDDWRRSVPTEWVKTIETDMKIHQQQPSYSEAYLAGMSANKRRKI